MATRKTSQAQHDGNAETPSNPFAAFPGMVPSVEMWRSMMEAQTERFEKMLSEMERLEKERHERAVSAIDDVAKLMKSSIDYQRELTDQWRKMGVEAAKKGAEMMGAMQG